jgi:ABC-type multidrug transport system permease subunit
MPLAANRSALAMLFACVSLLGIVPGTWAADAERLHIIAHGMIIMLRIYFGVCHENLFSGN